MQSENPFIAQQGNMVNQQIPQPNIEEKILDKVMPEIYEDSQAEASSFGKTEDQIIEHGVQNKTASAYIKDVAIRDLPSDTIKDISKFIDSKSAKVILYGMCVSELLPRVDHYNFEQAEEHINESFKGKSESKLKDEFFKKSKNKYILILNEKIIDGHHFLAKAKRLNVTSSLNVLDLTPVRFQEKVGSDLLTKLKTIYACNHRR